MLSRHHQVALLDENTRRVLVVDTDDGPRLPRCADRWPGHRDLVDTVGATGAFLCAPPHREDDGTVTNVLLGDRSSLAGASWRSLDDLDGVLSDEGRRAVVAAYHARVDGAVDDDRADWFRRGWRTAVDAWVDEQLPLLGLEHHGPPEPFRIWGLSAVLRYPVLRSRGRGAGAAEHVWFKATCAGFHGEPALTEAVCHLVPHIAPEVLAVDADRAWMLMEEIPNASDETGPERAPEVARALARLQLETLERLDVLLDAGAPHRGLEATLASLVTVVHESVELPMMTEAQRASAAEIEPWLRSRIEELWGFGLPDTIVHGDLHLGNVAWTDDGPMLFDWTDAAVSHPFLDAVHLAASAAENGGEEARTAVWQAYAEPWRAAYPDVDVEAAWRVARDVERVYQAITYEQIYRAQPAESRWELATVVIMFLDELAESYRARGR